MTVHRTNDRLSSPQGNQCLLSHSLASLGAQEKTNCTSMLWSVDSCQNLSWPDCTAGPSVDPSRSSIFLKLSVDKLPVWNDRGLKFIFPMIHLKYVGLLVVFMSLWPHTIKILFSNWPRTRNFSQFYKNTGREDLFLSWSRVGHALRPIFMLWLVKIWQVSSCGKFMQHLESCLLWQLALKLTEFCVNLWCF